MTNEACRTGASGHQAVSDFHQRLRQRPAEAFLAARALIMSLGPDITERVEDHSVCYLRREEPFITLTATKTRLQAVFHAGLSLPDPMGRLLKRGDERYLALDGPEAIDGHAQEFVRKAYTAARPLLR